MGIEGFKPCSTYIRPIVRYREVKVAFGAMVNKFHIDGINFMALELRCLPLIEELE